MAQPSLDDRIEAMKAQIGPLLDGQPQAPISTDNSEGVGPTRVYIRSSDTPESTTGGGSGVTGGVEGGFATGTPDGTSLQPGGEYASAVNPNALPEPTPVDNTAAQMEARRQQAIESLKADGFDGYTPDVKAGLTTPDEQHSVNQAVTDIASGFNMSLAKAISAPREAVDRAMGLLGLDYMQHGGPQQMTIDAMNRMGVPAYEVENLANKIGRGALPALATYTAMQLAAPTMAAQQGTGAAGYLMREIGAWAMKHPVVGLWLGQTSQAGGKIAEHVTGSSNALVEFGGELMGGGLPGVAKFAIQKVPGARAVGRLASRGADAGVEAIADALPTDLGNAIRRYNPFHKAPVAQAPRTSLLDPNYDANRLQTFSKDQITGAQLYQDKAIENAINNIPRTGTPAQVQTRTHNLLQQAETISKRIVSGFWERVPLRTRIPVADLNRATRRIQNELVDMDNQRPDAIIERIIQMTSPTRNPTTGVIQPARPTIQRLRDMQSQIGTAITEERARDAPREGMVRNMARLSEAIDENIAAQLPNDTTIEQARQMSKRHNDLFSRGPINDILSKRRTGDFRTPQADSIDSLMQKTDGLAALKAVQDGVSTYPRIPTNRFRPAAYYANPHAVTPAEKATLDELVKSAADSIRASFREAADQGPQKAVAYSVKNEEAIKALSQVAGELAQAAQKVSSALAEKKYIERSALARFAETSPDKAVANIFAQKDPTEVARRLMVTFRQDPDALEGLRNQVLDHFIYNTAKTNPNIMQRMLNEPRIGNLMEAVLAPDQFARLQRMVNTAVRIGVEDETSLIQKFKYPARTMGRIAGAALGRSLRTGTIQTPGIISKAVGDWMERRFGMTDPQDLLSMAVLDPNWEQLLYSRLPTTTKAMKAAAVHYRRMFATINSAQQATLNKLSKERDDNVE